MDFCYIAPTAHVDLCSRFPAHLLLAHLINVDQQYTEHYSRLSQCRATDTVILDNSAFELYKMNQPMFPSEHLMDLGKVVHAGYIVMSDYPGEKSSKTISAAVQMAPILKNAGFGTFFVPQSEIGDREDYIASFAWAACSPLVDYIGVSILGVPNAYGVERGNKLQRYVSRFHMMTELERRGLLRLAKRHGKKIHFLGMVDGPNEVELCSQFDINTWDSCGPIWSGLNNIRFDESPTGLVNGKYENHLDFSFKTDDNDRIALAQYNIDYIESMRKLYVR